MAIMNLRDMGESSISGLMQRSRKRRKASPNAARPKPGFSFNSHGIERFKALATCHGAVMFLPMRNF